MKCLLSPVIINQLLQIKDLLTAVFTNKPIDATSQVEINYVASQDQPCLHLFIPLPDSISWCGGSVVFKEPGQQASCLEIVGSNPGCYSCVVDQGT